MSRSSGEADEPVARSRPVSCRFRPYAVTRVCVARRVSSSGLCFSFLRREKNTVETRQPRAKR